ncbi:MAG: MBL fold metallo-hydrolase [Anaeroplasmataceae bacterium]|nr:MBL fold metallo-hydrolase [Anaeroplasmataceae bacterium]
MRVKVLVENTSVSSTYKSKHGLCLYIQTEKHKILFDLGSNKLFLENAKKMGINIGDIDIVVISHGHVDHAGALAIFLEHNSSAKIYIRESAFDKHYNKIFGLPFSVGIDSSLRSNKQIIFTDSIEVIDDELTLFSDVQSNELTSSSNIALLAEINGKKQRDDFKHEQNLLIKEGGKVVLFAGCAHAGIVNIKARAKQLENKNPLKIIGGFHLYNPISKKHESKELVDKIVEQLNDGETCYYTCHCTGKWAYSIMKEKLKDNLEHLSTGKEIEI